MNTEYYKVFLECAKTGNLTQSAQKLGYTQSGVSHIVALLEKEFGFPLFSRSKTGVKLTKDGAKLSALMREVINRDEQLHQLAAEIMGLRSGRLCIASIESVATHLLPELIKGFNRLYPNIDIDVKIGDYKQTEDMLDEESADCGFLSSAASKQYPFIPLFRDEFVALINRDSPLAFTDSIKLEDFARLDFIVPCEGTNYDIGQIFSNEGLNLNVKAAINADYVAIAMVNAGLGVTIMPKLLMTGMDEISVRLPLSPRQYRTIGIAYKSDDRLSPACKAFIEYVDKELPKLIDKQDKMS